MQFKRAFIVIRGFFLVKDVKIVIMVYMIDTNNLEMKI